jgi:hypothetical protein
MAGTVLPPPPAIAATREYELPKWSGSPLQAENRRCYVDRGTLLCLIGNPRAFEALALIDETDLADVRIGQTVRLQLQQAPTEILTGKVTEIAEVNLESAPPELVSQHTIEVHESTDSKQKPIRKVYQARVQIDASDAPLLAGSRGKVRIKVAPQTTVEKLLRWARHTFSLDPKP